MYWSDSCTIAQLLGQVILNVRPQEAYGMVVRPYSGSNGKDTAQTGKIQAIFRKFFFVNDSCFG